MTVIARSGATWQSSLALRHRRVLQVLLVDHRRGVCRQSRIHRRGRHHDRRLAVGGLARLCCVLRGSCQHGDFHHVCGVGRLGGSGLHRVAWRAQCVVKRRVGQHQRIHACAAVDDAANESGLLHIGVTTRSRRSKRLAVFLWHPPQQKILAPHQKSSPPWLGSRV
jgi:hypothetical protein